MRRGLGLHPVHRVRDVLRQVVAGPPGELGVTADGGQRRAQLVAGVGDELAHPRLTGLAGGQRGRDVAEQAVQCRTDLADLRAGVGVGLRHAFAKRHLAAVEAAAWRRGSRSPRPAAAGAA